MPERAVAKKLCDNRFVLLASPQYLKRHGLPKTSDDLKEHASILYRGPWGVLYGQVQTKNGWKNLETKPVFISNDGHSLVKATVQGHGIALLPTWGVTKELQSGVLKEITLTDELVSKSRTLQGGMYLLFLRPKYRSQKLKVAVDFILQELQV